jgi:hypothetical protein
VVAGTGVSGFAGPLTVARLLRFAGLGRVGFDFADRDGDLGIDCGRGCKNAALEKPRRTAAVEMHFATVHWRAWNNSAAVWGS